MATTTVSLLCLLCLFGLGAFYLWDRKKKRETKQRIEAWNRELASHLEESRKKYERRHEMENQRQKVYEDGLLSFSIDFMDKSFKENIDVLRNLLEEKQKSFRMEKEDDDDDEKDSKDECKKLAIEYLIPIVCADQITRLERLERLVDIYAN